MNGFPLGQLHFAGLSGDENPGSAAGWSEYVEAEADEKLWEGVKTAFKDKFKNGEPSVESSFIAETHGLGREYGETLSYLLKRAEKLYHQLRGQYRRTLLTGLVLRMKDREKDLRLQERAQDRLYSDNKWGTSVASESLTFNDVRDMIWECRSSTTEKLVRSEKESFSASEMDLLRVLARH
ncbi:Ribonuclease H [Fusarium albosuccineum]|uniref:Ribonuclease H n=1 Tax=Fusarium albosuccineum TaxID=1237068 RepID=A0A8H4KVZ2_9HYPO|nr:Ribonuclease H [Fusarium albosuccineum]